MATVAELEQVALEAQRAEIARAAEETAERLRESARAVAEHRVRVVDFISTQWGLDRADVDQAFSLPAYVNLREPRGHLNFSDMAGIIVRLTVGKDGVMGAGENPFLVDDVPFSDLGRALLRARQVQQEQDREDERRETLRKAQEAEYARMVEEQAEAERARAEAEEAATEPEDGGKPERSWSRLVSENSCTEFLGPVYVEQGPGRGAVSVVAAWVYDGGVVEWVRKSGERGIGSLHAGVVVRTLPARAAEEGNGE